MSYGAVQIKIENKPFKTELAINGTTYFPLHYLWENLKQIIVETLKI